MGSDFYMNPPTDEKEELRQRIAELEARAEKVEAIHRCVHKHTPETGIASLVCVRCEEKWPCETIAAIDDQGSMSHRRGEE